MIKRIYCFFMGHDFDYPDSDGNVELQEVYLFQVTVTKYSNSRIIDGEE